MCINNEPGDTMNSIMISESQRGYISNFNDSITTAPPNCKLHLHNPYSHTPRPMEVTSDKASTKLAKIDEELDAFYHRR